MGGNLQVFSDSLGTGIHTHIQQCRNNDQYQGGIQVIVCNGIVNIVSKDGNPQNTEDGGFPHDDFPPVEQKCQKLAVTSG